jgi:hypothetical protein
MNTLLILRKELLELRRSPVLLLSMVSLPATVVVVPVGLLAWLVHAAPEQALAFVVDIYGASSQGLQMGVAQVLARNSSRRSRSAASASGARWSRCSPRA